MIASKHPKVRAPGLFFQPKTRRPAIDDDELLAPKKVAGILGVEEKDVNDLVHGRLLDLGDDGQGFEGIVGDSLTAFLDALKPVEVELVEVADALTDEHDHAPKATAKNPGRLHPTEPEHDDGIAFEGACPHGDCGQPIAVGHGVAALHCPGCNRRLEVAAESAAEHRPNPVAVVAAGRAVASAGRAALARRELAFGAKRLIFPGR